MAPSALAVCPTSTTIRNFAGTHIVAAESEAEGFGPTGPSAACFSASFAACLAASFSPCRFDAAAGFAACEAPCFGGLAAFDEPLNISDSQPAWLASIGNNSNAAIAATTGGE